MREVQARPGEDIQLGRRGENLATRVTFDVIEWVREYGEGTVHLLHMRNGDKYPYPVAVEQANGRVTWVVNETDLAVAGRGRAELQYWVGDTRVKSAVFGTRTAQSLDNEGPSPDAPEASWVEKVLDAAQAIFGGGSSGGGSSGGSSSGGSSSGGSTIVPSGGSTGVVGAVLYNIAQALTSDQRKQARSNIGAASDAVESQVGGLVSEVEGFGNELSSVKQDVGKIQTRITNNEGDISTITQRVTGIDTRVANAEGQYSALHQTVEEIKSTVESGDNSSELKQTVDEIKTTVENQKGSISTLTQRADSVESRVEDAEGNISVITQEVDRIKSVVENPDGDYSSVIQRVDGIESTVSDMDGRVSGIDQKVDNISFEVSEPINGGTNRYVTLKLTIGGNEHTGVVMIDGNVDVSGQLSAEALYATLGDIARLKVDSLSTSRRIPKYLKRDTSDDNYIDIQEQHLALRRAWTDGSTEQARDDFGALLYWEKSIANATLGTDGYPYVDGQRVFITTEATSWPVTVYSYDSGDRLRFFFDEYNNFGPRQVWGEGYGYANPDQGKAFIQKLGATLDVYYHGADNVKRGIFIGDDAVDIVGERQPTKMVASGDTITVTYQGGKTRTFEFLRGTDGKISSVTYDGHTVALEGFD